MTIPSDGFGAWLHATGWAALIRDQLRPQLVAKGLSEEDATLFLAQTFTLFSYSGSLFHFEPTRPANRAELKQLLDEQTIAEFREALDDLPEDS